MLEDRVVKTRSLQDGQNTGRARQRGEGLQLSLHGTPRATPLGRSRYQTSKFLNTSELPTDLPTHTVRSGAQREHLERFHGLLTGIQGQRLASTAVYASGSLESC